jgi:hypothetical protein
MKKVILIIIIAASFMANDSNAQTYSGYKSSGVSMRQKFTVGLKAGANYSNVYDTQGDAFNANPKFGFAGGLFIAIPIGKFLGVQPEVLISQKGFKGTGTLLGNPYDITRTTTYLAIPLLLAIKPVEFLTILAGPQYSYLLKQKDVFSNASTSAAQQQEFTNDNIRKNTLSVIGGFDINIQHIVVSGRVGWDVQNNNGNGTSTTPRYKNAWTQATIGYKF